MSQSHDLSSISPSLFTRAVHIKMRSVTPLSPDAQSRLADWLLSKAPATPDYCAAFAYLNHGLLRFWQVQTFFHLLASSPSIVPNIYRTVVDGLLSLDEGVAQLGRDTRSVIRNIAETSVVSAPTAQGIPQGALEEALRLQERKTARVADELRVAISGVDGDVGMTLSAVSATMDDISALQSMIARMEAVMGSKLIVTRISSHRDCRDLLQFSAGRWELMTFPQYDLGRLADVILRKSAGGAVVPRGAATWSGWFSDPLFRGYPVVTIKFQEGVCVVVNRYFMSSGVPGFKRSAYLRSWELHGCVCGKWKVLDEQMMTNVLADGSEHEFRIRTERCAVEAIRICQTGPNGLGARQMHLRTLTVGGDIIGPPGMFEIDNWAEDQGTWSGSRSSNPANSLAFVTLDVVRIPPSEPERPWDVPSPVSVVREGGEQTSELGSSPELVDARDVSGRETGAEGCSPSEVDRDGGSVSDDVQSWSGLPGAAVEPVVESVSHSLQDENGDSESRGQMDPSAMKVKPQNDENDVDSAVKESDKQATDPVVEEHERTEKLGSEPNETVSIVSRSDQGEGQPEAIQIPEEIGIGDSPQEVKGSDADDRQKDDTPLEVRDGSVRIDEQRLLSETRLPSPPAELITDLEYFEEVRELGSSRFGTVRLLRRMNSDGKFQLFAAKCYNPGDNREGQRVFEERMKPLLELSHPHVMPIVGVIPPTKTSGPIILTEYSEMGSLEAVLLAVRRNELPPIWTNATKLGLIVSLVTGLNYLHKNGIVHRELKPNDLIVQPNGTLRICGYATSILEEHRYTKGAQVGGPSYMAPELYDDERDGKKSRDPKTDVFSFGLILFEILFGQKVFLPTMSTAAIMRKTQSDKAKDRPMIPTTAHKILQETISRSWLPATTKRPPMDTHWKRMREVGFNLFPGVAVTFIPLHS